MVFVSLDTRHMSEIVDDTGTNVIRNVMLGLLAIPVSIAVVYFLTHRPARPELRFWPVVGKLIPDGHSIAGVLCGWPWPSIARSCKWGSAGGPGPTR